MKIHVIGHKRPDTDSIAASISYAYLKNQIDEKNEYIPFRLGELNPESNYVLDYFNIAKPNYLEHVYIQVKDVMIEKVITADKESTIYEIGNTMLEKQVKCIPIVDENRKLIGLLTERELAKNFLKEIQNFTLDENPPKVKDIIKTMNGKLIVGDENRKLKGCPTIGAMSADEVKRYVKKDDVLITGNRKDIQKIAIEKEVSCLIITGNFIPDKNIIKLAKEKNIPIVVSPHPTYITARLLRLSTHVERIMEKKPLTTHPEEILKDFEEELMQDKKGIAIVVDDNIKVKGIITRHDLIKPKSKKIILVDHSEKSQTVEGIEEAEILEIIDHHRLGGLETGLPITAHIRPVGSTNTIIWDLYKKNNLKPPKEIAGLMISAILSDTMILKSPTTTYEDKKAVEELSNLLKIDPIEYGIQMYKAKTNLEGFSEKEILTLDLKETRLSKGKIGISQIEVINPDQILLKKEKIIHAMERIAKEKKYILFLFLLTDVLKEGSYIFAAGQYKLAEKVFKTKFHNQISFLEGIVSRKKQVMPLIFRNI
ncbi:manganese-dependent inorganic pyrophosphatase [Marinitoga hydrogenitolerans DSM 16785]|uniref:inorganic diphosphatase n=1 Tax=Marinitoga hydrogenitolerans (strain DSM 16785 / JCM 12826 / AT1271) TaxID=1122195 RepID=A0A1M4W758_MARH1|nr:putative manganese-dependent inorganic diphosphatase [Marinitoga hydrogenitolerans]SHE77098.1 manganese-dependent inorganic pyrophosphatase [Marinitoga hydrogenitolerans DSM 16785]